MANDQSFSPKSSSKQFAYYAHAYAPDDFDVTIQQVPNDGADNAHAKAELVFIQTKGGDRAEVVAAVRMQFYELRQLMKLLDEKTKAFLDGEK